MNRIVFLIKRVHLKDFLAPFIFLIMLIPSWVFRLINRIRNRTLWLVAEHGEARDNGYHFYKYVRERHPSDYCFYAIKKSDPDYNKVKKLGNVIDYNSLKHWLYYMAANLNISSQKSGNPSPIFFGFVHTVLCLYRNRVFLQHGIIKDDLKYVYYDRSKFRYFICGAKPEYDFVKKKFGYPEGSVLMTGLPRWDNLDDTSKNSKEKSILIMPTWRSWLDTEKNQVFKTRDFKKTDYYAHWNGLLNNPDFISYIEKTHIKVYFYPHFGVQKYIDSFNVGSKNIEIVTLERDIQEFFCKCNVMVTDYSSVAFDFAYLCKSVIYYQFDKEKYRKLQHAEGYFKYERDGFGDVVMNERELIEKIKFYARRNFRNEQKYITRDENFFILHDHENCDRVYRAIK